MPQIKSHYELIVQFDFLGQQYRPSSGVEALIFIFTALAKKSPDLFDTLTYQLGLRKNWLSRDPQGFHRGKKVPGTQWWLDTCMNTRRIMKTCDTAVSHFGLKHSDLSLKTKEYTR